jgi:hypothetical protein
MRRCKVAELGKEMDMRKAILMGAALCLLGSVPAAAYIHGSLAAAQPVRIAANDMASLRNTASLPPLAGLTVKSADGMTVGTVKSVITDADGKPAVVDVTLDNARIVGISAGELSFDAGTDTLISTLTAEEIKSLPPEDS